MKSNIDEYPQPYQIKQAQKKEVEIPWGYDVITGPTGNYYLVIQQSIEKYWNFQASDDQEGKFTKVLDRYKQGIKWYNSLSQALAKEGNYSDIPYDQYDQTKLNQFQLEFSQNFVSTLCHNYNLWMYDLSIEKTLELHAYMSNVVDNSNIARISGSMEMLTVLKSKNLVFNIENKFLDNFSRIFHRILENFFSEDNFEFDDDKITNMGFQDMKSFLDMFLGLISSEEKSHSMSNKTYSLGVEEEKAIVRNVFKT